MKKYVYAGFSTIYAYLILNMNKSITLYKYNFKINKHKYNIVYG